jgi:hypothetical protein
MEVDDHRIAGESQSPRRDRDAHHREDQDNGPSRISDLKR